MQLPFRSSLRQYRRQPLYAFACAGTLAMAVAAATASLAVVQRAFLDPLPYRGDGELVSLFTKTETRNSATSPHVYQDLLQAAPPLTGFIAIRPQGATYLGRETAEPMAGMAVTSSFFTELAAPAIGRVWEEGDRDSIVISWDFWKRTLGGEPNVIGRRIRLDMGERTIAGVMPEGFVPPYFVRNEFWSPIDMQTLLRDVRGRRTLTILARRAPGASKQQVDAHLTMFSKQLQERFPTLHGRQELIAISLRDDLIGESRPVLLGAVAAAALLLLIVASNIAGLSVARAVGQQRQLAVRAALGASGRRLMGERLLDSLAIAIPGTAAGVWLAGAVVKLLTAYQSEFLFNLPPITLDGNTMMGGFVAGILTGAVAAVLSQSAAAGSSLDALRGSRASSGGVRHTFVRSGLVVVQVALAFVLVAGAGLLVRTVRNLATTSLGFESDRMTTFALNLPTARYQESVRQIQFERDVLNELRAMPGVTAASASVGAPVVGGMGAALSIFGRSDAAGLAEIAYFSVSPDFMSTFKIPVKAGRGLLESDTASADPVVVINETMAAKYWPAGDAVGARVQIGPGSPRQRWITIVGIVGDVRQQGPVREVRPTAFGSTLQYSWPWRQFTVRTAGLRASLASDLRAAVRRVDSGIAVSRIAPMDELVANQLARHRLVMMALTFFGGVAVTLSAFGLFAVVSLTSQLRRREYAIRMALGSSPDGVMRMVARQAVALAMAGTVVGIGIAGAGTRVLQGLLHGVAPVDYVTYSIAAILVLAFGILSAWIPARRAGRVDPLEALSAE